MTKLHFQKAELRQKYITGLLNAPSGAGKTWTALAIAQGLAGEGGKVVLLDTERGSATMYARQFDFIHADLPDFSVKTYLEAITQAVEYGASVVVVDSLSHAWEYLLQEHDNAEARQKVKNSFTAWKEITPIYRQLIEGIVSAKAHIICTTRAKTEYVMEEQERNGKTYQVPKKVGLAPVFRQGGEYEFDWIGTIDLDHTMVIEKSRISFLADRVIKKPDGALGAQIREWISTAKPEELYHYDLAALRAASTTEDQRALMKQLYTEHNAQQGDGRIITRHPVTQWEQFLINKGV